MKPIIPFALLGALLAAGAASAATTTPVGYTTQAINQGFNPIGLTLHAPILVSGDLEAVSGATLTDSDVADFATVLPAGRTYILEITSGTALGATQEFTSISGSTITLPGAIGVAVDDTYQIRVAPTLEEVFGTTTSILTKANTVGAADVIHLPNGSGGYTRYFLNLSGAYRNATVPGAAPNVPIVYLDGLFVERKAAGSVSLTVTGEVKKVQTLTSLTTGFNLIGTLYPAGTTLQNFGLDDDITRANTVGAADVVHVPNGSGGYTRYFLNLSNSWRNATVPGAAPADLPLTSGVFIERKGAPVAIDYTPPSFYSTL